jgi:DNA-binding MarR family transcriptional regulator
MSLHATADTSRDAFSIHKASGKLTGQQYAIVAFLSTHKGAWTRSELAEQTGIKLSAICGRVSELLHLGPIEELPRRRCGVTGSNAHPVQLARKQASLF